MNEYVHLGGGGGLSFQQLHVIDRLHPVMMEHKGTIIEVPAKLRDENVG